MTQLPIDFTDMARRTMGEERFDSYLKAFETDAPVSIRLNPEKAKELLAEAGWDGSQTLRFFVNSGDGTFVNAAQVMVAQWAAV